MQIFRSGSKCDGYSRVTIIIFTPLRSRTQTWDVRHQIKNNGITVIADLPAEWATRRKGMKPVMNFIRQCNNSRDDKVSLRYRQDKLEVNGKLYSSETLHELPGEYSPAKVFTPTSHETVVLFTHHYPFFNHHPASFTVENVTYNRTEQSVHYVSKGKAVQGPSQSPSHSIQVTTLA